MTKEEALKDLKAVTEAISVVGDNHGLLGTPISKFTFQHWILRLNEIVKTLEP